MVWDMMTRVYKEIYYNGRNRSTVTNAAHSDLHATPDGRHLHTSATAGPHMQRHERSMYTCVQSISRNSFHSLNDDGLGVPAHDGSG